MNPIESQLVDSSRLIVEIVASNIGKNQQQFDKAAELMFRDVSPLSMRAARVVQLCVQKHTELIAPHLSAIIENLPHYRVDGVKRSALCMFVENDLPLDEDQLGKLTDICFRMTADEGEAIAVRAYALDILLKVIAYYPELKKELIEVLEKCIPFASPGLGGRFKKILQNLIAGKTKKYY